MYYVNIMISGVSREPACLDVLSGIDATAELANAVENKTHVQIGQFVLTTIRSIESDDRMISVSASTDSGAAMLLKYDIDDKPVILPIIQLLGIPVGK